MIMTRLTRFTSSHYGHRHLTTVACIPVGGGRNPNISHSSATALRPVIAESELLFIRWNPVKPGPGSAVSSGKLCPGGSLFLLCEDCGKLWERGRLHVFRPAHILDWIQGIQFCWANSPTIRDITTRPSSAAAATESCLAADLVQTKVSSGRLVQCISHKMDRSVIGIEFN